MLPKIFSRQSGSTGAQDDGSRRSTAGMLFGVLTGRVTKNVGASSSTPSVDLKREGSLVPAKFCYMVDQPTPTEPEPQPESESGSESPMAPLQLVEADEQDDEEMQGPSDESEDEEEDEEEDLSESDESELIPPEEDSYSDDDSEWECVDRREYEAYEEHKESIDGSEEWLRDEIKLHRNLALRGMFPLMPGSWATDFLGLPVYPILFAPPNSTKPVVIHNMSSQFRATRAMRNLFELQARIAGLRSIGVTSKIAAIIEKEFNRYIQWAMKDAGLDRYEYMSNLAVRRFDNPNLSKRRLARMLGNYLKEWAADYRAYYAARPAVQPVPRLLYVLVIVQHAVLLFTLDSARPKAKPRAFANFDMSQEEWWLDSSLNVAIPVHLARERLVRMIGTLPEAKETSDVDVDL